MTNVEIRNASGMLNKEPDPMTKNPNNFTLTVKFTLFSSLGEANISFVDNNPYNVFTKTEDQYQYVFKGISSEIIREWSKQVADLQGLLMAIFAKNCLPVNSGRVEVNNVRQRDNLATLFSELNYPIYYDGKTDFTLADLGIE